MLPNPSITPIPNNEPDAVPSLGTCATRKSTRISITWTTAPRPSNPEIEAARAGKPNLSETINAIVTQIGGISGTLNGLASPTSAERRHAGLAVP